MGSKLYPTKAKVILKYYLDEKKKKTAVFCFTIEELLPPEFDLKIVGHSPTTGTIEFTWQTPMPVYADAESGCLIYYSTSKKGPYCCLAKVPNSLLYCKYNGLERKHTYYIKIRSYFKKYAPGSRTVFSEYSNIIKHTIH